MVQNMENNDLFRKKAVERITSPEKLNDYIHVTSPSIWMALGAIILILVGALVWATFSKRPRALTHLQAPHWVLLAVI